MHSYLTHGHISTVLTVSTMFPVLKDKLGNHSDSNNYRCIATSSVIQKLFDCVIIILYQDCLHLDQFQFSYQPNCSTTMCTWQVLETIDYFLRNGSEVFVCMMDMTKAFFFIYAFMSRDDNNPRRSRLIQIYSVDWKDVYDTYNIEHRTESISH